MSARTAIIILYVFIVKYREIHHTIPLYHLDLFTKESLVTFDNQNNFCETHLAVNEIPLYKGLISGLHHLFKSFSKVSFYTS